MIRPKPDVPERVPVISFPTPEGQSDLLFYEIRDGDVPKNKLWSYGDAHPDAAKFPNHELVFVAAEGGAGWQRWYYAANRENQHLYNWQFTDTTDWPQLAQTFIVRRSEFSVTTTYEMPPKDVIPYPLEWSATGIEERPINDETLASTFVTVVVTREKIRVRNENGTYSDREIVGREFDPDTNSTTSYRRSKVPAGTSIPEGIQSDGSIVELQPVNTLWSIKNTKQAAGLAGKAISGKASRTFQIVTNWAWPAVLDYVRIQRVTADGTAFSATTGYITVPIYSADAYSGPCLATIVEEWTSKLPIVGGNKDWDSTVAGTGPSASPQLRPPTPLLPKGISFNGDLLRVSVPECLHGVLDFYEGSFSQVFPATNYPRWPGSIVAEVDLRPSQGGWLKRTMIVDAPSQAGVQSEIVLELAEAFATSFRLRWNLLPGTTVLNLDISTDPAFRAGSFLPGYANLDVRSTPSSEQGFAEKLIEGASRSVVYYCRLKSSRVDNNETPSNPADDRVVIAQSATLAVTCPPLPEIYLATPGPNWPATLTDYVDLPTSTGTVAFGDTQTSSPLTKSVIIQNRGLLPILNLAVGFSGTNGVNFSVVGGLPTSIDPGEYAVLSVRFAPTTIGGKTATMTVTSNASNTPSYTVALSGNAVQPEIDVRYLGASKPSGGPSINLGNVYTGSTGTFTFDLRNEGNGSLTASITAIPASEEESLWSLESPPVTDIPALGSDEFIIKFTPTASGLKTLNLSIANNDPTGSENPYLVTLEATGVAVGKIDVDSPLGLDMVSGESYYCGYSNVGTQKLQTFEINNLGAAPLDITSIVLSGTDASQFSVGSLTPVSPIPVGPTGNTATFVVGFTPVSTGTKSATLSITSSDPSRLTFTVNLSGTGGSAQEIRVELPEGVSLDGVTDMKRPSFGAVVTGSSRTLRFWIRNVGNARLGSLGVFQDGPNADKYFITALTPAVNHLDASESAYFDVTLTPGTTVGYLTSQLTITSNDANEASYQIGLNGYAYAPGSISRGQPSSLTLGQTSSSADVEALTDAGLSRITARPAVSVTGRLAIADTLQHRVLIWNSYASLSTGKAADRVLGQVNFTTASPPTTVTNSTLLNPVAVAWYGEKLLVSDTGRNRILIWNNPTTNNEAANIILGGTAGTSATRFRRITDIFVDPSSGKVIAADPDNYRVLIWSSFPAANNAAATVALGQSSTSNLTARVNPRSLTTSSRSFVEGSATLARISVPSSVCVSPTDGRLYVADSDFRRVLIYSTIPVTASTPPLGVLFQTSITSVGFANPTGGRNTTDPLGVAVNAAGHLAVGGLSRVLLFYGSTSSGSLPDAVLGWPTFDVDAGIFFPPRSESTLLTASGVAWAGGDLLVTDRNRVVIFKP